MANVYLGCIFIDVPCIDLPYTVYIYIYIESGCSVLYNVMEKERTFKENIHINHFT